MRLKWYIKDTRDRDNMRHSGCVEKTTRKDCGGRPKEKCVSPCDWVKSSGYCRPGNY